MNTVDDGARWERLVAGLREDLGRVPVRRDWHYPDRADLLHAMLTVAEQDPATRAAVHHEVRAELTRRVGPMCAEIAAVAHDVRRSGATRYDYPLGEAFAMIAARLEDIARVLSEDQARAAGRVGAEIHHLEHTAGAHIATGPQQRALLDLARRLRALPGVDDPPEPVSCTFCGHPIEHR